jgi:hypothetical protein
MPVGIRLGLVFKETQIITKYDVNREVNGRDFFSAAENKNNELFT